MIANQPPARLSQTELRVWMVAYLARLLELHPQEVDPAKPFELYGLDSSGAVGMSGDLEDLLGAEFDTTLIYDHPTIDALVSHLVRLELVRGGEER